MRRMNVGWALLLFFALWMAVLPVGAQQPEPVNPRIPPPPPPEERVVQPPAEEKKAEHATPPLPPAVVIPSGTRIAVVLDTPLSTRISKPGEMVTFRTVDPLRVHSDLEIPPDTGFTGSVVKVKRPGRFGRPGELRVKVERINLSTGARREVVARLDSPDANGQGQISSDNNRAADLYSIGLWTLQGTLLGAQIKGGKGAAVGAGAGAAIGLIILMSRRGPDIYLEPGMPFLVILDQPVELPGAEVFAAQQTYARTRSDQASDSDEASADSSELRRNPDGAELDRDRPKLKRRPKTPQP